MPPLASLALVGVPDVRKGGGDVFHGIRNVTDKLGVGHTQLGGVTHEA